MESADVLILIFSFFLLSSGAERSEPLLGLLPPLSLGLFRSDNRNGDLLCGDLWTLGGDLWTLTGDLWDLGGDL